MSRKEAKVECIQDLRGEQVENMDFDICRFLRGNSFKLSIFKKLPSSPSSHASAIFILFNIQRQGHFTVLMLKKEGSRQRMKSSPSPFGHNESLFQSFFDGGAKTFRLFPNRAFHLLLLFRKPIRKGVGRRSVHRSPLLDLFPLFGSWKKSFWKDQVGLYFSGKIVLP